MFIYPSNLKSKPNLWFWQIKDVAIIVLGAIISVLALVQTGILIPLAITAVYAVLSIQIDESSILKFIKCAFFYFIIRQQRYDWRA